MFCFFFIPFLQKLFLILYKNFVMFCDFGQPKTSGSRKKTYIPKKSILYPPKKLYPEKIVYTKKSFSYPKISTTLAERCIPKKTFCTPKKVAPGEPPSDVRPLRPLL